VIVIPKVRKKVNIGSYKCVTIKNPGQHRAQKLINVRFDMCFLTIEETGATLVTSCYFC
jgi:hypothetical protein